MAKKPAAGEKADQAANLGFEAKLWLAADKLRNNLDAAENSHVVLGLIFRSVECCPLGNRIADDTSYAAASPLPLSVFVTGAPIPTQHAMTPYAKTLKSHRINVPRYVTTMHALT